MLCIVPHCLESGDSAPSVVMATHGTNENFREGIFGSFGLVAVSFLKMYLVNAAGTSVPSLPVAR